MQSKSVQKTPYLSRRAFLTAAAAAPLAACSNGLASEGGQRIDIRVDNAMQLMYREVPGSQDLEQDAAGMLIMPLVTEAGFGFGGSYGRGALRINNTTVDYYSAISGTFGLQIGAQQYSHALFFMTPQALSDFRNTGAWAVGADVRYAVNTDAANLGIDSTAVLDPVIAVVFGQAGLIAGATLDGTRYNRILP